MEPKRIAKGIRKEESLLSVRTLAKDLRISALTVKKAYDTLKQDGFIVTVHGKVSFVAGVNVGLRQEEQRKEIEQELLVEMVQEKVLLLRQFWD